MEAALPGSRRGLVGETRPLGLAFFGAVWVLSAWCELRNDFRNFRPARIELLDERFEPEPGKTFEDFVRRMNREG